MTNNEDIIQCMRDSGVPSSVLNTTLLIEQEVELRGYLSRKDYRPTKDSMMGVFIHPATSAATVKARRVFHVMAKEMVLNGESLYSLSLSRIVEGLTADEAMVDAERAKAASVVLIADFYERGAPFPLQPWQAGVFRSWVKEKYESGGAVCLLSDGTWKQTESWWPQSFTGFLMEHTRTFSIG